MIPAGPDSDQLMHLVLRLVMFMCIQQIQFSNTSSTPPHIIVIVADDLGWNDLSYHGSNQISTPNIDALAYTGLILNRHYVLPSCTPSRSALLTGKHPITLGMQGYPLRSGEPRGIPLDVPLLPEYLQQLKYSTHLIGKWHVGFTTDQFTPPYRGADSFFGYYSGMVDYFFYGSNQTRKTNDSSELYFGYDLHCNEDHFCYQQYSGKYATHVFTEEAVHIIHKHQSDRPLFLMVNHLAVHTGTTDGSGLEVPPGVDINTTFPHIQDHERRLYAAMLTELDISVGRLVKALEETTMLQDCIIVVMSDNGAPSVATGNLQPNWGSNYPLRGSKMTLYEGGVRCPALIWSNRLPRGAVYENFMHISDWVPTLVTAAGGNASQITGLDGTDMWANLQSLSSTNRSLLVNIDEVEHTEAVIVDSRWKLVKGGMRNFANFDHHAGKLDKPGLRYRFKNIRNSLAGRSILRTKKYQTFLTKRNIRETRKKTRIQCGIYAPCQRTHPQFGYVNASTAFYCKEFCVFDIVKDPCECSPLSTGIKDIKERGIQILEEWRQILVPQSGAQIDQSANPALFGCVWRPWRQSQQNTTRSYQTKYNENCM